MAELILELFSEEIPARMQAKAAADLERLFCAGLRRAGLAFGASRAYATPRRLTLHVADMARETEAVREELKGPRTDAPAQALDGFLRKTGLTRDRLETREDKKGAVFFAVIERPGRAARDVISELAPEVLGGFPWPKSMRWGAGDFRWVRPLRSILCVLADDDGAEVPAFEAGGVSSGDVTYGHRFLDRDRRSGAPRARQVASFAEYLAAMKAGKVTLDGAERAKAIDRGARRLAKAAGLELLEDPGLLRETAGLVEHPVPLMGRVAEPFQSLPPEVLQTSMREHQKFFALREPASGRVTRFVTVANIAAKDKGAAIIAGNER
ncbi:MAG: glycine--tRNA ligase subunit beta, partial [Pseudomonadota bacterium]